MEEGEDDGGGSGGGNMAGSLMCLVQKLAFRRDKQTLR
jgi:hypothetical protein